MEKEYGRCGTICAGLNSGHPVKLAAAVLPVCQKQFPRWTLPSADGYPTANCEAIRSKGVWSGVGLAASSATCWTSGGNRVSTITNLGLGQGFKVLPWSLSVPDRPQYRRLRSGLWACRSITAAINRVLLTGREKETELVLKKVLVLNCIGGTDQAWGKVRERLCASAKESTAALNAGSKRNSEGLGEARGTSHENQMCLFFTLLRADAVSNIVLVLVRA